MQNELLALWLGLICYVMAGVISIFAVVFGRKPEKTILTLLVIGLLIHGLSIGLRWDRLGYGPFTNMFEILSSNIWSLLLIFTISYWRIPAIRPISSVALPIMFIMMAWIMMVPPDDGRLPSTYNTVWLYVHIGFGKIFLGTLLIATGIAIVMILREFELKIKLLTMLPNNPSLDELAFRFVLLALVFDSLMLVAGGIWAQDAWGRYWSWDPLETWSFITWVGLALLIHIRLAFKPEPWVNAMLLVGVFIISYLTFFGVPFINQFPHKGVI